MTSSTNIILANIVNVIHLAMILFGVIGPFTNNRTVLKLSLQLIIFVLFHWITKFGKCQLTELEARLRGQPRDQGYIYKILQPIINVREHHLNYVIYIVTVILGMIAYNKLMRFK